MTGLISCSIIFLFFCFTLNKNADRKEDELIVFRLAETFPREHPSAMASEYFAGLVSERTNGRIQIKVYFNGELGNEKEVIEQMGFGGIALARVNFLALSDMLALPKDYIALDSESLLDKFHEDRENIAGKLQLEKISPLVWYYPDIRCFYNNKLDINGIEDFKGLRLQTSSAYYLTKIMKDLGVEPVSVLTMNALQSLNSGFIDGGETTLCEFMLSDCEPIALFATLSGYINSPDCIVASSVFLSKLSRDDQALLKESALDTFEYQKQLLIDMQKSGVEQLKKKKFFTEELLSLKDY